MQFTLFLGCSTFNVFYLESIIRKTGFSFPALGSDNCDCDNTTTDLFAGQAVATVSVCAVE